MQDNSGANQPDRQLPPESGSYPCLVYSEDDDDEEQVFFLSISDPKRIHRRRIPELHNKICWTSTHGWYLLSDTDHCSFFLWKPISSETIELPTLQFDCRILDCILTTSPEEKDCKIFLFAQSLPLILILHAFGDEQWTKLDYEDEVRRCLLKEIDDDRELNYCAEAKNLSHPIKCDGKLYVFSFWKHRLLEIEEINKNRIVLRSLHIRFPGRSPHMPFCYKTHFVENDGEIYGIRLMGGWFAYPGRVIAVDIHVLDLSRMEWRKVESLKNSVRSGAVLQNLGGREKFFGGSEAPISPPLARPLHTVVFFLSNKCAISCPTKNPELHGNLVYFTWKDRSLYSYNIEDGSLSLVALTDPRAASFWVMPQLRSSDTEEEADAKSMEGQGSENGTNFSHLPSHIISLIIKRLILAHYLNFRATCRLFRSLAPPIQSKMDLNVFRNHSLPPLLMFFEKDSVCTFFEPSHGDKHFVHLPQLLLGCVIWYAKDGWILMSRAVAFTYCYNPFTEEILRFPNTYSSQHKGEVGNRNFGFLNSPTSSECTLFEICSSDHCVYVSFARLKDTEWSHRQVHDDTDFEFSDNSPVFYDGAFYYLGEEGDLGILEISDEVINWKVLSNLEKPCSRECYKKFLVECGGELLSVFVNDLVQVFRLNQSKMTWIQVESLGNRMIFISRKSSFSAEAKRNSGMENKIFFPILHNQSIVYYSLDTRKFHSFDQKDVPVDFYNTREQLHCVWIEPRFA